MGCARAGLQGCPGVDGVLMVGLTCQCVNQFDHAHRFTGPHTRMLKGIPPLLSPDLLHALASMGHGDELVLADANFPAATHARRLIHLPGSSAPDVLQAILALLPLDDFVAQSAWTMQVVGDPAARPPVVAEFDAVLRAHGCRSAAALERFDFYHRASAAFAIVATGETRIYGNILLKKGVVRP